MESVWAKEGFSEQQRETQMGITNIAKSLHSTGL